MLFGAGFEIAFLVLATFLIGDVETNELTVIPSGSGCSLPNYKGYI